MECSQKKNVGQGARVVVEGRVGLGWAFCSNQIIWSCVEFW